MKNICETEIGNLSPVNIKLFSSESSIPPTSWILPKLYKSCRRNSVETLEF